MAIFYRTVIFAVNVYDIMWSGFVTFEMVAIFCASALIVTTSADTVAVTGVI
jgi:hypothetical protein